MKQVFLLVVCLAASISSWAGEYTFNSDNGELTLVSGVFNKDNKFGNVNISDVMRVVANENVSFEGDCSNLFDGFGNCSSMDLSDVNTAQMTTCIAMFNGCAALTTLDLSNFDTSNVGFMNKMFYGCSGLATLDLLNFDTGNVGYMSEMFYGCANLTMLDLSGWNTGNVETMSEMFSGCTSLTTIYAGVAWNTDNDPASGGMFHDCYALRGGVGTTYDENHSDAEYACIDQPDHPGYFTGVYALTLPADVTATPAAPVTHGGVGLYVAGTTVTLSYNGGLSEGEEAIYSVNGGVIVDDTFVTTYGETTVTVSVEEMPRYRFYESVGLLKFNFGDYNKDDKWGDDVPVGSVTSITAADGVRFTGDCSGLFTEFANCSSMDFSNVDTGTATNMEGMFENCTSLTTIDLTNWDTGNVTDMAGMFYGCSGLSALYLSGWNTSKVIQMGSMFAGCTSLATLDLSGWDTGTVSDMTAVFMSCRSLTSLDISGWNTASAQSMRYMFGDCPGLSALDLSGWDTSNVEYMSLMFYGCSGLTSLDVSGFDTGKVTSMEEMFNGCTSLTTLDLSGFDTGNVTDMTSMFINCTNLGTLDLSGWCVDDVNMTSMFNNCSALTTIYVGAGWSTEYATGFMMFLDCTNLVGGMGTTYDSSHIDKEYARIDKGDDEPGYLTGVFPITFDEDVTATATLTHGDENLFAAGSLVTLSYSGETPEGYGPVYSVNGTAIKGNTFVMPFEDVTVTVEIQRLRYIFDYDSKTLTLVWGEFNKDDKWGDDISEWQIRSVTATDEVTFAGDCSRLFYGLSNCESMDLNSVNTDNVSNMSSMFADNQALTTLNISDWNTANVTNMESLFDGCANLSALDLSLWDTGNVTNMGCMFDACLSLTTLDLSGWNTANVIDMKWMFIGCMSLSSLDISSWNTTNVTDMTNMFKGCTSLATIYVGSDWSTENVSASSGMFYDCYALTGGAGTTYDENYSDAEYACIDQPDHPGYLTGVFSITLPDEFEHGTVEVSVGDRAIESGDVVAVGATVLLAVSPDSGYELQSLTVTIDVDGEPGGAPMRLRGGTVDLTPGPEPDTYTFVMPVAPVTVNATFKEDEPSNIDGINRDKNTPHDGRRYNLLGQPVGPDYKGIVIENGKKCVVL